MKPFKKFWESYYLPPLVLLVVFMLGGLAVISDYPQTQNVASANFHGPHTSNNLVAAASRSIFTWSRLRFGNKQQRSSGVSHSNNITTASTSNVAVTTITSTSSVAVATVVATPSVTIASPSTVASPPVSTSTVTVPTTVPIVPHTVTVGGSYGIAAGGGLIWLGQSDLDAYFSALQALGVTWVRWDMDWSVIQPSNAATYNWKGPDLVAATAAKYGIHSLAIITYAPQWALDSSKSCTVSQHCPPQYPAVFARFAATSAARYKGVIDTWEIWNEPNLNGAWAAAANGAGYAAYLKASYTAIKQVNPDAVVLTGGLAAAADEGNNTSPTTFISTLYASGAQNYFDAIALHPYSYPIAASYSATWNSWQQMSSIRQLMLNNGDSAKKIWITEYGTPTGGPGSVKDFNQLQFTYGSDYMSELAQEQMLKDVITLYSQDKSWMGPFFWYSLKDESTNKSTPENFFGLLRSDWSKKPAYGDLRQIITSGA